MFLVWPADEGHILCTESAEAGPPRGGQTSQQQLVLVTHYHRYLVTSKPEAMSTDLPVLCSPAGFHFDIRLSEKTRGSIAVIVWLIS